MAMQFEASERTLRLFGQQNFRGRSNITNIYRSVARTRYRFAAICYNCIRTDIIFQRVKN